jgi:uncharacterized protein YigE (DUF2233 family)
MKRLLLCLVVLACACNAPAPTPVTPEDVPQTPAPANAPAITPLMPDLPPDTGWQALGEGLELRRLRVHGAQATADRLFLVRLDTAAQARLAVAYAPDAPATVAEWAQAQRAAARFVVNAGYFTEDYRATGLLVADGVPYGTSFAGAGGMLAVQGGRVEVRWLRERPLQAGEVFDQAVQGWPMLLAPDGTPVYTEADAQVARRTAVGLDRSGRLVFIVSAFPFFTLHGLAEWLSTSDLDLGPAFNLDGGQSTGLWAETLDGSIQVDSYGKIPAVIVVRR